MTREVEELASATPSPLVTVHRLNQLIETYKFAAPHQASTNKDAEKFRNAVAFVWYSAIFYVAGADKTLYRFNRAMGQFPQDWWADILTKVHSRLSEVILKEELYELMRRVDKIKTILNKANRENPVSVTE